jgi:short-subunit dehydrogenase
MSTLPLGTALVTGASSGIGAMYAKRLAARGHNLVLVARGRERLQALADTLRASYGVDVEVLAADLSRASDVQNIANVLRENSAISVLVNNAGLGPHGKALDNDDETLATMLDVNVTALHSLAIAAGRAFAARGNGAIINIASVVALMPEYFHPTYVASKAFVLAFSQSLAAELAPSGVKLQAVLPGLTRTEIFDRAGGDISQLDPRMVMEVADMVDAALAGFDQGEAVTIPSLPNAADWQALQNARQALAPNLSLNTPAPRYGVPG